MSKNKYTNGKSVMGGLVPPIKPTGTITTASFTSDNYRSTGSYLILCGKHIIIKLNQNNNTYCLLRDFFIRDFEVNLGNLDYRSNLGLGFLGIETRDIIIPDHIPKEQYEQYIKRVFKVE